MVTLFYSPRACSQAPHILLHEIGVEHDAAKVNLRSKTLEDGSSYLQINPKGSVPAIRLESGEVLTENAVILQYLADSVGATEVLPPVGDVARYHVLEWVNFITTELHKSFSPLFDQGAGDEVKHYYREHVARRLDYVERAIGEGPFLMGDTLRLPDPYLFVITGWTDLMIGLDNWPNLTAFRTRMLQRPWVRHVLRFEGLLKEEVAG
jgi:glutathione S-transferase